MSADRIRRDGSRFGERLIRAGRIRWLGEWWRIKDGTLSVAEYLQQPLSERALRENRPAYDGRLDGLRGLFYNYRDNRAPLLHSMVGEEWPGSHCVGGVFCWDEWVKE